MCGGSPCIRPRRPHFFASFGGLTWFLPYSCLSVCSPFLSLSEVQVLYLLRMGLLWFCSHPALEPLISVLRIPGLAPHNMVWPFKYCPRSLKWFTLGDGPLAQLCSLQTAQAEEGGGTVCVAGTFMRCTWPAPSASSPRPSFPCVLRGLSFLDTVFGARPVLI